MPILVQLGQCGNQIGAELTHQLYESGDRSLFFTEKKSGNYTARSVLVDMEPKVLTEIVNKKQNYDYAKNNIITPEKSPFSDDNFSINILAFSLPKISKILTPISLKKI